MNKEFVHYEQALALKELGFDEPCLKYWNGIGEYFDQKDWFNWNQSKKFVSIPLYQQAFRWFREKYNLDGYMSIDVWNKKTTTYSITGGIEGVIEATSYGDLYDIDSQDYDTYGEAELECLKQLIEIVKNK